MHLPKADGASARQVALLRAVNLGAHGKIAMADLRAFAEALGLGKVATLLQSGNLVFTATGKGDALENRLEKEAAKQLDLRTDFFVRDAKTWRDIVADNPFAAEARNDPGHLVVMVLKHAPEKASVEALRQAIKGRERIHAAGKTLYITYPDGIGRSKLTIARIEKALATRGTGRNWNTVTKLAGLL